MSTHNIVAIVPRGLEEVVVTFRCKDGTLKSYLYEGADAIAVMKGSDPADLNGKRVRGGSVSLSTIAEAAGEFM